jgi:mycofactocin precursor
MSIDTDVIDTAEIAVELSAETTDSTGTAAPEPAAVEELLVEEVSIDGMCGVY